MDTTIINKRRICFVATNEMAVRVFLLEHIRAISEKCDVTVVFNTRDVEFLKRFEVKADIVPLAIERKISLCSDIRVLIRLIILFRSNRFDAIHSMAPKSGLLAMLAGFVTRIPIRIHTFTGQVWVTRTGMERWFLKCIDKLLATLATNILVDSRSQKIFLVSEGILHERGAEVLEQGSFCGVDPKRFSPNINARKQIREKFCIPEEAMVFLFLGRLNRDKGVLDLVESFYRIAKYRENAHLILVGPDEESTQMRISTERQSSASRIHFEGFTDIPEQYMAAADVLCLPSYREGFGAVIIEAGASGIPSIGSRIYGITDAIEEGITGLLYEAGNIDELTEMMMQFIDCPDLIRRFGDNARKRVLRYFSQEKLIKAMLNYYESLMIV